MNNKIFSIITFIVGAGVGAAVTWKLLDTKYRKLLREEVDDVKEYFNERLKEETHGESDAEIVVEESKIDNIKEKPSIKEMAAKIAEEQGYAKAFDSIAENEKKGGHSMKNKPYVISPDEFDELEGYAVESLTYYADKVLTDEDDNPINNIDELIGKKSLETFGQYEDDSVFVRNDDLKIDFEILLDLRKYSDVKNRPPHQVD